MTHAVSPLKHAVKSDVPVTAVAYCLTAVWIRTVYTYFQNFCHSVWLKQDFMTFILLYTKYIYENTIRSEIP